jgi:hypothetical protein
MWTRQSLFSHSKETLGGWACEKLPPTMSDATAFLPDFHPTQKATFEFLLYFPLSRLTIGTEHMDGRAPDT